MTQHTRKWLLLRLLEDAGKRGACTADLLNAGVGSRYSARLMELRDAGYTVESVRERQGSYRYKLLNSPDDEVESGRGEGSPSDGFITAQSLPKEAGHSTSALSPEPSEQVLTKACQAEPQTSLFGVERHKGEFSFTTQERAA